MGRHSTVGTGPACCRRMAPRCRAPPDLSCPLPEGRSRRRAAPVRCPHCHPAAVPPPPAATAAPALHPCGPATGPGGDTMLAPRPHMPVSPGAGMGRDRALGHPASTRPRLLPAARQSGTTGEGPSSSGKGSVRDARAARCSLGQKMLCSGTHGTKPRAGLVQASPSVSAASSSRDWSTPGTGAPWGHMHPEDQSTPGTGEPWGPVQPGDLSTLGTRAPQGLDNLGDPNTLGTRASHGPENLEDHSTLGNGAPWRPEHPRDWRTFGLLTLLLVAAPGVVGDTMPGDAPGMWAAHTLAATLSRPGIRDSPSPSPNYRQRATKATRPLPHATNCRDAATRKHGGYLPVPGVRAGLQRLWSQRSRARHQPGQALYSPVEGGQRCGWCLCGRGPAMGTGSRSGHWSQQGAGRRQGFPSIPPPHCASTAQGDAGGRRRTRTHGGVPLGCWCRDGAAAVMSHPQPPHHLPAWHVRRQSCPAGAGAAGEGTAGGGSPGETHAAPSIISELLRVAPVQSDCGAGHWGDVVGDARAERGGEVMAALRVPVTSL